VTADRALSLESQLRLIEWREVNLGPVPDLLNLWLDAFWHGVAAMEAPRAVPELEAALELRRAMFANLLGDTHAHHRPRTDPATPARRKGDAEAACLAADLAAEARRARDRERRQRAYAHQHPGERR
jgi:hypothetical protein